MARHTLRPLRQADAVPSCTSGVFFREWNDLVDNPRFPKEFSWNSWERHLHQWAGQPINLRNHQTEEFWESACIEVGLCVFLKIPTKSSKQCVHYVFLSQLKHWNSWYLFPPISTHFSTNHETKNGVFKQQAGPKKNQPTILLPIWVSTPPLCHIHICMHGPSTPGPAPVRLRFIPENLNPGKPRKIGLQVPAIFHHLDVFILKSVWWSCCSDSVMQKLYWKKVLYLVCDSWKSRI